MFAEPARLRPTTRTTSTVPTGGPIPPIRLEPSGLTATKARPSLSALAWIS